jgi:hypothetical protein
MPVETVFKRAFGAAADSSLLYVVLWLIGRNRGPLGLLVGTVVIIATLTLPLRYVYYPTAQPRLPWIASAVLWTSFALCLLLAPRLRGLAAKVRTVALRAAWAEPAEFRGGHEVDFLIGTAQPWLLASQAYRQRSSPTSLVGRSSQASGCSISRSDAVTGTAASFAEPQPRTWLRIDAQRFRANRACLWATVTCSGRSSAHRGSHRLPRARHQHRHTPLGTLRAPTQVS